MTVSIVKADLNRLNNAVPGLGTKAVSYVLTGKDETVLSTLSNGTFFNLLELEKGVYVSQKSSRSRRVLLSQMQPYETEFAVRYARVLHAASDKNSKILSGSKHPPSEIRSLFSEIFFGVDSQKNNYIGNEKNFKSTVSTEIGLNLVKSLGGKPADYFDVIYNVGANWSAATSRYYRKVIDIEPAVKKYPDAVVTAGRRVNAEGRERLIQDITAWGLLEVSPFFDFVFGCISDGAKKVREAATSSLKTVSSEKIEALAISELETGTVAKRAAMVDLLAGLGSSTAMEALKQRKEKEKAARIIASIDTALAVEAKGVQGNENFDTDSSYTAIDGTKVEIPPMIMQKTGPFISVSLDERVELEEIVRQENEKIKAQILENKRKGYRYTPPLLKASTANDVAKLIKPTGRHKNFNYYQYNFLSKGAGLKWINRFLDKQSPATNIEICLNKIGGIRNMAYAYSNNPFKSHLMNYFESSEGDLRYLEHIELMHGREISMGAYNDKYTGKYGSGDFLRFILAQGGWIPNDPENYPSHALWPYLAQNLDVFDEAFGLKPQNKVKVGRIEAIQMLTAFPQTPLRFFGPLLEAATGVTKAGRQESRDMLQDVEDVDARLVTLLQDTRQAIRAGTANWMAERRNKDFVKPLKARLKKEKSEVAKAAMLTALDRLGEDLSSYVGTKALIAEAEANIKKAKFEKLNWLGMDHLPSVKFKSGARVPDIVLRWWIYLAFKLKEPGGNKLFQLYLDQLTPESAQTFSGWILDSWVNYDTQRPSDEDANKYANEHAKRNFNVYKKWIKDYTIEKAFAGLKREFMGRYLNTGAASKGILALAYKAKPTDAANRVQGYLKAHGSRTSQASSLLSVLAAKGDPVSLQVVIAAATRLKQKGVQAYANTLLEKVAEDKGWTLDELADRTIPTAGFDDSGVLELPCGPDAKLYKGVLTEALKIELRNPDGKTIKGLGSIPDENTKASKKQLSTSRKELKQVVSMQSARLYEALCAERVWLFEDWTKNFVDHPIMRKLVERVVWLGLDKKGRVKTAFRPTAEGDYTDVDDNPVDIKTLSQFRIAHGASMTDDAAKAWGEHLQDYEIEPLFSQFGRSLKRLSDKKQKEESIEDRKGWITDTFTIRGVATKLGYDRGQPMDGGYFNEYSKSFRSAGIVAVIEFSGNCLPEENVAAALISLSFFKLKSGHMRGGAVKLDVVPPVLLSECWNDYHAMAAKGAFDEGWEGKMPWM